MEVTINNDALIGSEFEFYSEAREINLYQSLVSFTLVIIVNITSKLCVMA